MQIGPYEFPDDLYYDDEHNWARVEDKVVIQGMSDMGQDLAGEIVYAETPRVGREVEQGKPFMSMESGKWVGRVKAVVSGKIVEANEEIEWESTIINESPYDQGWLVKIEAHDLSELDALMKTSDPAFAEFIAAEREKYDK
jgi:glycine cleavage system H protein